MKLFNHHLLLINGNSTNGTPKQVLILGSNHSIVLLCYQIIWQVTYCDPSKYFESKPTIHYLLTWVPWATKAICLLKGPHEIERILSTKSLVSHSQQLNAAWSGEKKTRIVLATQSCKQMILFMVLLRRA